MREDFILVHSDDIKAIRHLQRRRAEQLDPTGHLWSLRVDCIPDFIADLHEHAPHASGWIAEISDFQNIN